MESRLCCWWTSLWIANLWLGYVTAHQYTLSQKRTTFNEAMNECSPGTLATVIAKHEVQQILELINNSVSPQEEFIAWIGLRRDKKDCVVSSEPLRGYKWIANSSQETQVSMWLDEPKLTCTELRCAAIKWRLVQSEVELGLVPAGCKNTHRFICKLSGAVTERSRNGEQTTRTTAATEPEPKRTTPGTKIAMSSPYPVTPRPKILTPEPEGQPGAGSGTALDLCQHPGISGNRALSLDPRNVSKIRVECWSSIQLDLFCAGRPGEWRMLDGSPANLSSICVECDPGFEKNASGYCVDVDECRGSNPCRYTCLNTEGSYRCLCAEHHGNETCHDAVTKQGSFPLTTILIPAVVGAVVLLVLIVVLVICCLRRRSKKRAKLES
ncbi:C-type lectin domain family 14 member A [Menidia menidia]